MVEWKKLGDIANLIRGKVISKDYIRDYEGPYPVYSSQTANEGILGCIDKYMFDGEYLTWTTDGAYAGTIFRSKGRFNITNVCGLIDIKDTRISQDFLYYWLSITAKNYVLEGMGNPKLMSNVASTIRIPIPPLSEQQRIVGILDTFTASIDNLKEQIAQRRKQYEYYRDQLLDLEGKPGVKIKTLGELCVKITDGSHFSPKSVEHGYFMPSVKDMTNNGFDFSFCKKIAKEDYLNLINTGCKPVVNDVLIAKDGSMLKYVFPVIKDVEIVVLSSIAILTPKIDVISSVFLSYYLKSERIKERTIREFSSKGGVPRIILKNFKKIIIFFPPLAEQSHIVSILDTFEASIQNLEAQLKEREKQYEYYRNKLLTFE